MTDTQPFDIIPARGIADVQNSRTPSKETILLVDPDCAQRQISAILLSELHLQVLEAKSEIEAIELFNSNEVAILLTRLRLIGTGGVELARKVQRIKPEIRVIFTSVCPYDEVRQRHGEAVPRISFVQSPLSVESLRRALIHSSSYG